jgi:hypothetical protein
VPPSADCTWQNPKLGEEAPGGAAALHHAVHCSVPASTPEVPASPRQGIATSKLHTWLSQEVALWSCGAQSVGSTFDVVVVKSAHPRPPELAAPPLEELELAPPDEPEPAPLLAPPELPELPELEPPGPGPVV